MSRTRMPKMFVLLLVLVTTALFSACPKKPTVEEPVPPKAVELSVLSVRPNQGRADQVTLITIGGTDFKPNAKVTVGTAAPEVTFINDTSLRVAVPSGMQPGTYDVTVVNPDGKEGRLKGGFTVVAAPAPEKPKPVDCQLEVVYFDFDVFTLSDTARETLQKNASCLKARNARRVELQGHADERGSTDYNLALGQHRADEARRYLQELGFSEVKTLSFGEEKPASDGTGEEAWSQNRRVESIILE